MSTFNKENLHSNSNHFKKTRNKKEESKKLIEAMNSEKTEDMAVESFCDIYNKNFAMLDGVESKCDRLRLLRMLDEAIKDRFDELNNVIDNLLESYRMLITVMNSPTSGHSSSSPSPQANSDVVGEYLHYFKQWFRHVCRAMLSLLLLQEGKSCVALPKEEEIYRCRSSDGAKKYFTLRSIHSVDRIYNDAVEFFRKKDDVVLAIDGVHLHIDSISNDISERQKYIAGFMKNVQDDLLRLRLPLSTFICTDKNHWRFLSKESIPKIVINKEILTYDAKTALSGQPFEDSHKYKMLQRKNNEALSIFAAAEDPPLPPVSPVETENNPEVRMSVSERVSRRRELEELMEGDFESDLTVNKQQSDYPTPSGTATLPVATAKTLFLEDSSPNQAALMEEIFKGDDPNQPIQDLAMFSVFPEVSDNEEEDLNFLEASDNNEDDVTLHKSLTTRSKKQDPNNMQIDPYRAEMIQNEAMCLFRDDQDIMECFDMTRNIFKSELKSMYGSENKTIFAMREFLKAAIKKRIMTVQTTKKQIKIQFAKMIIDLYHELREEAIQEEEEKIKSLPPEMQKKYYQKDQQTKKCEFDRIKESISVRYNRLCLGVAMSAWDEICRMFFETNPFILERLLSFDQKAFDDPNYWREEMQYIKESSSDFFEKFDIVQFANQLQNTDPCSSIGTAKLLIRIIDIEKQEVQSTQTTFKRILTTAVKLAEEAQLSYKAPVSYKGMGATEPKKKRAKIADDRDLSQPVGTKRQRSKQHLSEVDTHRDDIEVSEKVEETVENTFASFEDTMDAFGTCCSNTLEQLGVELVFPLRWPTSTYFNYEGIFHFIIDLLHEICGQPIQKDIAIERIASAFLDTLPLMLVLHIPGGAHALYNHTPANGRCHYLVHYQLARRAEEGYCSSMEDVKKYLSVEEGFDTDKFIQLLQEEYERLSKAVKSCPSEAIKEKMQSLIIKISNVIHFEKSNRLNPKAFMSMGKDRDQCIGGKDRWGALCESGLVFFDPNHGYSMAMFHEMDDYIKYSKLKLPNQSKYNNLDLSEYAIYVTSTNMLDVAPEKEYMATMRELILAMKGLNFGCFDGSHFFPLAIPTEDDKKLIELIHTAFKSFCADVLKVFNNMDKEELNSINLERFHTYRGTAVNQVFKATSDTVINSSSPQPLKQQYTVLDLVTPPTTLKQHKIAVEPSASPPPVTQNVLMGLITTMKNDVESFLLSSHPENEWETFVRELQVGINTFYQRMNEI